MADHTHTCAVCGHTWECVDYTEKQCRAKGVFRGMQVNKVGPYCWVCYYLTMALRHLHIRGELLVNHLPKVTNYEILHGSQKASHQLEDADDQKKVEPSEAAKA